MARGQSFEDFLAEDLSGDDELALEVCDSFDDMRLAVQLAMARERAALTQLALAHKSGVTQPMISRIERGDQQPTWPTIRRLIAALDAEVVLKPDGQVEIRLAGSENDRRTWDVRDHLTVNEAHGAPSLLSNDEDIERPWHSLYREAMKPSATGNQVRQTRAPRSGNRWVG